MRLKIGMYCAAIVVHGIGSTALASMLTFAKATAHAETSSGIPKTATETDDLGELKSEATADALSSNSIGNSASATAQAHAKIGDLGVYVVGSTFGEKVESLRAATTAQAIAYWEDTVVVSVPGIPDGRKVIVEAEFDLSGTLNASATHRDGIPRPGQPGITPADSEAQVSLLVQGFDFGPAGFQGVNLAIGSRKVRTFFGQDDSDPPPSSFISRHTFTNGKIRDFLFEMTLSLSTVSSSNTKSSADGDFSGSLHWGGIRNVADAETGEVFTDWTITSESGFDYSKSLSEQVPEPGSLVIVGLVLCVAPACARSRCDFPRGKKAGQHDFAESC